MTQRERPLSPHLQVYRFQITMLMSISHRIAVEAELESPKIRRRSPCNLRFRSSSVASLRAKR